MSESVSRVFRGSEAVLLKAPGVQPSHVSAFCTLIAKIDFVLSFTTSLPAYLSYPACVTPLRHMPPVPCN